MNNYAYLRWAEKEGKRDALYHHVLSEMVILLKDLNKFSERSFDSYEKTKRILSSAINKLAKIKGRK